MNERGTGLVDADGNPVVSIDDKGPCPNCGALHEKQTVVQMFGGWRKKICISCGTEIAKVRG
jgi:hypothetical protein